MKTQDFPDSISYTIVSCRKTYRRKYIREDLAREQKKIKAIKETKQAYKQDDKRDRLREAIDGIYK